MAPPSKTLVLYQEVLDGGIELPKDVVIDVWISHGIASPKFPTKLDLPEEVASVVKRGYRCIVANGLHDEWYLNNGWGDGRVNSLWATQIPAAAPCAPVQPLP